MNAPLIHRSILKHHIATVEADYPLKIVGLLPRGAAPHVANEDALDLLAEKQPGLDLLGLCEAEAELSQLIGRPVGIVLRSGLDQDDARELPSSLMPL
jgi:predicted nucleotidyltransferase